MSTDSQMFIVFEKCPQDFERKVNEVLAEGRWRVVHTEVYETNHHYTAILVRRAEAKDE